MPVGKSMEASFRTARGKDVCLHGRIDVTSVQKDDIIPEPSIVIFVKEAHRFLELLRSALTVAAMPLALCQIDNHSRRAWKFVHGGHAMDTNDGSRGEGPSASRD